MKNYLNIRANKIYLPGTKKIQKESIFPNKKNLNKLKRISPNRKKRKQIINDIENQPKNILTGIRNLTLPNDNNKLQIENSSKNVLINRINKEKIKDFKKVQNSKNSCNNNVLKLQKKIIHQNKNQRKIISSIPLFNNYIEKSLSLKNTNKTDRNKTRILKVQRAFSIYEPSKTFINSFNLNKRNNVVLNANYYTEVNYNKIDKTKSADVSLNKIKQIIKIKKNLNKEEDNTKDHSMIIRQNKKTTGVIKLSINDYFNKNKNNKKAKLESVNFSYKINKNPQIVEEYFDEIHKYLKSIENSDLPKENYMKTVQKDITEKMRIVLVDWLIDVHSKFKLVPETLFLTINIIDRYLSKKSINRKHLQLLGITALFIASKYEDIYPPELKDFIFMTDNAYKKEQVIKLENDILDKIEFSIAYPTSLRFLEIYKEIFNYFKLLIMIFINNYVKINLKEIDFFRCRYFIEIALLDYNSCHFSPSLIAVTSIFLNYIINNIKNKDIKYFENKILKILEYDLKNIKSCLDSMIREIKQMIELNNKYSSIKRKYDKEEFMKVSREKIDICHIIENIKINN